MRVVKPSYYVTNFSSLPIRQVALSGMSHSKASPTLINSYYKKIIPVSNVLIAWQSSDILINKFELHFNV